MGRKGKGESLFQILSVAAGRLTAGSLSLKAGIIEERYPRHMTAPNVESVVLGGLHNAETGSTSLVSTSGTRTKVRRMPLTVISPAVYTLGRSQGVPFVVMHGTG